MFGGSLRHDIPKTQSEFDELTLVARDTVDLLYKHGMGGISVSAISSALLVLVVSRTAHFSELAAWWLPLQLTLLLRGIQLYRWTIDRAKPDDHRRDPLRDTRQFTLGTAATAFFWALFPMLFFKELDLSGRATLAIFLSGMAGGSTVVLAAKENLTIGYCAALLLPTSLLFFAEGSLDGLVLGSIGVVFFTVLTYSARVAHQSTMRSVRLARANEVLLRGMESAQHALQDANLGLEIRVRARTEELTREIHEKERYEQELSRMARHDTLTGLYNRASLTAQLETALRESAGKRTAVLFIDLDKFKEVNDVRGHCAGDHVLKTVSERLLSRLGPQDKLARWGGDEFVVIVPNISDPGGLEAILLANTLCACLAQPIDIEPEAVTIGATIGIALFPEHGRTQEELIRAADVAMYEAKQDRTAGRIRIFDQALADDLARRHRFAQALGRAIAEDTLTICFQPIVMVPNGRCVAMEALLRWKHPELGLIPPSEFIPLAERSGDIVAIGRWVLHEACRIAAGWPGEDPPAVSVNVSTAQVAAGCIVDDVVDAMRSSGLPPSRLHIELTESLFAGDQAIVGPTLQALRRMGIRISLDDFGTGFSSLAYLRILPVDTIKIDKSFVDGIEGESRSIINAIVSISRAMDFDLIAEGVETERQMAALVAMGVTTQQGYLLSKPLQVCDVPAWLQSMNREKAPISSLQALSQAVLDRPLVHRIAVH